MSTESYDSPLDRTAAEIRDEAVDPAVVASAAARVWDRLSREGAQLEAAPETADAPASVAGPHALRGCDDFQAEIPAYLRGELPAGRALLVEDHTRTCLACRRAVKAAQNPVTTARPAASRSNVSAAPRSALGRRWTALAAALVLLVGAGLLLNLFDLLPGAAAATARIESVDGTLFILTGSGNSSLRPVAAGERLDEGDEVRTAKGSGAVVRLADGSLVELGERAALSYDARRAGTTLHLGQGKILIQAAKQRDGNLFVATEDCLVAVTGTIFAVNHGTKGSRVSVVEGEVQVTQEGKDRLLHPGQQVTTHASVETVPVADEISWSRDADRYRQLLAELTSFGQELDAAMPPPGLRTSTRLLDLAPQGTMIWIALPNLSQNLAETQRRLDQRVADNPLLQEWWGDTMGNGERSARFRSLIEKIGALGAHLGAEVAVAVTKDGPVALAEVADAGAFRAVLEAEAAELAAKHGHPVLVVVDDPAAASLPANGDDRLLAWVSGGLFVATPDPALLARVAAAASGTNPFQGTPFHGNVAAAYADGAGWLFAGDLKTLMQDHGKGTGSDASEAPGSETATVTQLGLLDLDHVIIDHRQGAERSQTRAVVAFDQARRGIAAWLADPAPMGALDFVSTEATLAAGFVVKNPALLLDDLISSVPDLGASIQRLRDEKGFDLQALAAPLGGEMALAVDGPLLPTPAWKLVLEVYDPTRLQAAFEDLVRRLDAELASEGKPGVELRTIQQRGRTSYALVAKAGGSHPEIHYLYADGYLVMAPSRALLDRALQVKESGATLVTSARFQELLPEDRQVNFSAVVFHDLGQVLGPLAEKAGRAVQQGTGHPGAGAALALAGPTLSYAYGEDDRIVFASNHQSGPLGFNLGNLVGLGGLAGMAGGDHGNHGSEVDSNESND